jgi:hypothetical protein
MKKLLLIIPICLMLSGCFLCPKCTVPMSEGPTLPDRPRPLLMDNGKVDTKKYPNTTWVKEPKMDLTKGIACWSNKDVEAISGAIVEREEWADTVEETLRKFNETLKGGDIKKDSVPWYKKLF